MSGTQDANLTESEEVSNLVKPKVLQPATDEEVCSEISGDVHLVTPTVLQPVSPEESKFGAPKVLRPADAFQPASQDASKPGGSNDEAESGPGENADSESATIEKGTKKNPEKNKKNKTKKKQSFVRNRGLWLILAIVVVLILAIVVVLALRGENKEEVAENHFMDQIREQEVVETESPILQQFFNEYYEALAAGNTTKLESMYDDPSQVNITTEISSIVDSYDNFKIYETQGIEENTVVAFVYNDIHFKNMDATAPSVDSFYLWYDPETMSYKIDSWMYTNEDILKFMNLVSYREPIRSLLEETNEQLDEILSGNKELNNLYILMQSMAQAAAIPPEDENVPADESAAAESETESKANGSETADDMETTEAAGNDNANAAENTGNNNANAAEDAGN